jgi:outer membrane protein assembly factor BamE (lipoprotein component of BamABCDE complex)
VKKLLVLVCLAVLVGCAGTRFRADDVARIHNGMTEAEVTAILGRPYSRIQSNGQTTKLVWSYATAFGGGHAVAYTFQDGKVVGSTQVN